MNLTRMANFNGRTFIQDAKLKGRKYAVRYKGESNVFHVSPAVFALLESDMEAVANTLRVVDRARRQRAER